MSHIVESCPLTKLNGGLSRLHSPDEDADSWLTNYTTIRRSHSKFDRSCLRRWKLLYIVTKVNTLTKHPMNDTVTVDKKLSYRQQIACQLCTQTNTSTEMAFEGHLRSSEMSQFDTVHMTSYYHSTVTVALSCIVSHIQQIRRLPVVSRTGRTEYQLLLMKASDRSQNVKL